MSGPIQEYTVNYQFEIPAFDFPNWHTYYARTLRTIDALFVLSTGISFVRGPWANGVNYNSGDVVVDMSLATSPNIFQALVNHTSAATGSFFDDRSTHPTYWQPRLSLPQFRGTWVGPSTGYFVGDFVVSGTQYAIARTNHISGASFAGDVAANWTILVDLGNNSPAINSTAEDTIAAAATTNIGSKAASYLNVTGAPVSIASFGTSANTTKVLRFTTGGNTLVNSGTLITGTGANIILDAANDIAIVTSDNVGTTWRLIHLRRFGSDYATLGRANTWVKPQTPTLGTIASGVAADLSQNQLWTVTVNGSTFTIANPSVAPTDKTYVSIIVTFATTNTLAFGTKFKTSGYVASIAGNKDHLVFLYDSGSDQYWLVGVRNQVNI